MRYAADLYSPLTRRIMCHVVFEFPEERTIDNYLQIHHAARERGREKGLRNVHELFVQNVKNLNSTGRQ